MKFTASAKDLLNAVSNAASVTPTKSASLVAYTGINLSAEKDKVKVSGSDGEVTVSITLPAEVTSPGSALVVPKNVKQWLANTRKDAHVTVSVDNGGKLALAAGSRPYKFNTMVATFPSQDGKQSRRADVNLNALAPSLPAIRDVAAEVVQGTGQSGIYLEVLDNTVQVSATDLIRVARASVPNASSGGITALIDSKALDLAVKLSSDQVGIDKSGKVVTFTGPDHTVTVRVLDAEFPPVENILQSRPSFSVAVDKNDMLDAIERLASVSDADSPVVVEMDGSSCVLRTHSVAVGEGAEEVELSSPAPAPVTLGANLNYVKNAVSSALSETVSFGWTSPVMPIFLESRAGVKVTSVFMPMRLST